MKPKRQLVLRRERLTDLDGAEMRTVAGATHVFTDCGCVTHGNTCDACDVPTLPVNGCPTRMLSMVFDICSCTI